MDSMTTHVLSRVMLARLVGSAFLHGSTRETSRFRWRRRSLLLHLLCQGKAKVVVPAVARTCGKPNPHRIQNVYK
jgi:hypothetical protein